MRLKIVHTTRYEFSEPVTYGLQQLRKTPLGDGGQRVIGWRTGIEGGRRELSYRDFHGNLVELVSFEPGTQKLVLRSEGEVEMTDTHGVIGPHRGVAPLWLFTRPTPLTRAGARCRELLRMLPEGEELARLHALSAAVAGAVRYEVGASEVHWSAEDALAAGRGVCQDHAHVFVACARVLGLPARYVSGYLMTEGREVQDAAHAWAEAHVPGLGWVDALRRRRGGAVGQRRGGAAVRNGRAVT